jgi:hypothetical protein
MDDRLRNEILAAHADVLNAGEDRSQDYVTMFPAQQGELMALFHVAALAKRTLEPVEPSANFRQQLGSSLTQAAQERILPVTAHDQPLVNRDLVIRAAAAGSALAGASVLALMWRSRAGRSQPTV